MNRCCDCETATPMLYSMTCTREREGPNGKKTQETASRALCFDCANKEAKKQGLPAIKEVK